MLYWYLDRPATTGVYPARVAGTWVVRDGQPIYKLPVVWVRPHPWAEVPPWLVESALVGPDGAVGPRQRGGRPSISFPDRSLPAWRHPRALRGHIEFSFPAEGFTVEGVRWQFEDEPERFYRNGPLRLIWSKGEPSTLQFSGLAEQHEYPYDEPGEHPLGKNVVGVYLHLTGSGRIVDLLPPLPGTPHPPEGMRYRPGQEEMGLVRRYYEDPVYQDVTLPWDFSGTATLYIPLPPEARERMHDTYIFYRPNIALEENGKRVDAVFSGWGGGQLKPLDHVWSRYYIYTAE